MANFETVEVSTDLLILGGGFSACGVATEAAYWAKKNNLKVTLVDKAAMDRSGAVAMGLSAINQYVGVKDGDNTLEDYVRYVRQDLMGISREDVVYNIARHVDSSVHLFEKCARVYYQALTTGLEITGLDETSIATLYAMLQSEQRKEVRRKRRLAQKKRRD